MLAAFGLANLIASRAYPLQWVLAVTDTSKLFWDGLPIVAPPGKCFYILGLVVLEIATIMLGLGSNVYLLVASRLFQGLSAAIIYTGGLALLRDNVGLEEIGKWMGFVLSFANAGILISPTIGGILYWALGANAVFLAMGIVVLHDIILRLVMVETNTDSMSTGQSVDEGSLSASAVNTTESDQLLAPKFAVGQRAICQDEINCKKNRTPTLLVLLGRPRILATMYGVMLAQTLITSFDGVLTIFVQQLFGWDSTRAGLMFLTVNVPTLAAPLAGMLSDMYGPHWVAASGFIIASGLLALLPSVTHDTVGQVILSCILLTSLGFAFSLIIPPLAADLASAVEEITEEMPELGGRVGAYGQAFSLLNCGISPEF